MGPSTTNGAVIPLCRRAPTKVMVFQWPCGTRPTNRSPRAHRPLSRAILVLAAVSSMKTSRAGSNMPCSRIQRRRARITSARFCSAAYKVFFKADVMALVEPPQRGAAALDSGSRHCADDLIERHVGLLDDQPEQEIRVFIERRDAAAA